MGGTLNYLVSFLLSAPGILFALTVHEYSHARAAFALGDPTARNAGRITLNPLRHLDLVGTVMLFLVHFGWAKPVPVNPYLLRSPRRDIVYVSLAGPAANLISSVLLAVAFRLVAPARLFAAPGAHFFLYCLAMTVYVGFVLAVFNLLPVPPLDGFGVLTGLMPSRLNDRLHALERYGFMLTVLLVILLASTGVIRFAASALSFFFAGRGIAGYIPG